MVEQSRILVVDDDQRLRGLLRRYLADQGFQVDCAEDGIGMDRRLAREDYAALVLDLMLPGEDGLSICRRLRATGNTLPIVILTAKGEEIDRILGLEMGADDYLPKPFNPRELLARLRAVLRRASPVRVGAACKEEETHQFGPFTLDTGQHRLYRNGEVVKITGGEFALLRVLVENAGRPLSRDRLMTLSQGREYNPFDRSIDVLISRLRRIIEADPGHPRYLQTLRGVGYLLDPEGRPR
ncbi:osmolarity response regulator transcription factor OmpR [Thiolapillus brandeum]|uniref:Two-component system OmpR family phosphate regulon response regulator OmpR n=1 Tax=Thiolapillus brandeum TaxID=1076588 RepID=A0A7U6GHA2_9GAMM|nr:two-component system response regulator OmpR [Thiolapillus brandeum]BAO43621.1 two-component system OmpR family phosphate regulon response regulator OmpR [Thiolapillus brandeum]